MFKDRAEAGRLLADRLGPLDPATAIVLALPRGGVPVAAEIARASGVPLDLVFVRKIGAPGQPELALGAIVDGAEPQLVINTEVARAFGLGDDRVRARAEPLLAEIERRRETWLGGRQPLPLKGKTAIIVDDGIATGASIRAALKAVDAQAPARVTVALPVAPADAIADLAALADDVVCLQTPTPFIAVGNHYRDFAQVTDREVAEILASFAQ